MKRSGARRSRVLLACAALMGTPLFAGFVVPGAVHAQSPATVSSQQLDSLTAPIALYPDALLAQVLMASTFPQDVQDAAAWSKANPKLQGDDAVKAVASEPWDPSVQSLVAFPQVLATMASKPDWVAQIGNAFLAQPNDVMDSVQRLRKQAHAAGNLQTTAQQKVVVEQSTIQIEPANPQVVYVPTYNPTVVYGTWPYPAYPPVYMPPPPGYAIASGLAAGLAFGAGVAVANSLWGGFNWNTHDVNVNVNRYNNINVHNRLDTNSNTTHWNRNANVNNANINRNNINRNNLNNANLNRNNVNNNIGGAQRDAYRGRDDARAQAQQTLQNRTGQNLGGNASERVQGIHQGGAANPNIQNRAQNLNRDNALRGAGDGNGARQDAQRGQASRANLASAQHHPGGGRRERRRPACGRRRSARRRPARWRRRRPYGWRGWRPHGRRRWRQTRCWWWRGWPSLRRSPLNVQQESLMMRLSSRGTLRAHVRTLAAAVGSAGALLIAPVLLTVTISAHAQAVYPSATDAVDELVDALARNDEAALKHVLGNDFRQFIPTENVDQDDIYEFLGAWSKSHRIIDDPATGGPPPRIWRSATAAGRLPIPLVQAAQGWHFDPPAARDEMLTRRIGRNERAAMHDRRSPTSMRRTTIATRRSTTRSASSARRASATACTGRRRPARRKARSVLSPPPMPNGTLPEEAYHGYHYRILTAQGPHAKGGAQNYVEDGVLTRGFGLIASPAEYGKTGVMSFIVNQDGQVYEKNLGPQTARVAGAIRSFDPGDSWQAAQP